MRRLSVLVIAASAAYYLPGVLVGKGDAAGHGSPQTFSATIPELPMLVSHQTVGMEQASESPSPVLVETYSATANMSSEPHTAVQGPALAAVPAAGKGGSAVAPRAPT